MIQKRFCTRETIMDIGISPLAETPPLYHDWLRSLNLKKENLFELNRGTGG